jgi:predicted ester cyclase
MYWTQSTWRGKIKDITVSGSKASLTEIILENYENGKVMLKYVYKSVSTDSNKFWQIRM